MILAQMRRQWRTVAGVKRFWRWTILDTKLLMRLRQHLLYACVRICNGQIRERRDGGVHGDGDDGGLPKVLQVAWDCAQGVDVPDEGGEDVEDVGDVGLVDGDLFEEEQWLALSVAGCSLGVLLDLVRLEKRAADPRSLLGPVRLSRVRAARRECECG